MASYKTAILEADKLRIKCGLTMFQPVNVFDISMSLGINVRFVNISMEGMYTVRRAGISPTIILSNQRPFARRYFTCAHELGHHIFEHGEKIDVLANDEFSSNSEEEILVNTFAAALLMPVSGIQAEFAKRGLGMNTATAQDYYAVASVFGVGYRTLLTNCRIHKLITSMREGELSKHTPNKLFKSITGLNEKPSHFKVVDGISQLPVIDLEASNYLVLPASSRVEGNLLEECINNNHQVVFIAKRPGVTRISYAGNFSFVRIQNRHYVGLVENRHLEDSITQ
jgi:Zn-dependent peptidase ImmA (M78 family)